MKHSKRRYVQMCRMRGGSRLQNDETNPYVSIWQSVCSMGNPNAQYWHLGAIKKRENSRLLQDGAVANDEYIASAEAIPSDDELLDGMGEARVNRGLKTSGIFLKMMIFAQSPKVFSKLFVQILVKTWLFDPSPQ